MTQIEGDGWQRQLYIAARNLVKDAAAATAVSPNEQNLRYAIEASLEKQCASLTIPWTPFQLDRALRNEEGSIGFADVVRGGVIIEYESPRSFSSVAKIKARAKPGGRVCAQNVI